MPKKHASSVKSGFTSTVLKESWTITKENYLFLLAVSIITLVVSSPRSLFDTVFGQQEGLTAFVLAIIGMVLSLEISLGSAAVMLKVIGKKKTEIQELFRYFDRVWNFFLATCALVIAVLLGFIALIIPGIYIAVRLMFVPYVMVEKALGPMDALKQSWQLTSGHFWKLFILSLVITGINLLGLMLFFVGLFVTIPLSSVAGAIAYKKLK